MKHFEWKHIQFNENNYYFGRLSLFHVKNVKFTMLQARNYIFSSVLNLLIALRWYENYLVWSTRRELQTFFFMLNIVSMIFNRVNDVQMKFWKKDEELFTNVTSLNVIIPRWLRINIRNRYIFDGIDKGLSVVCISSLFNRIS